jgi:hypothetical protein
VELSTVSDTNVCSSREGVRAHAGCAVWAANTARFYD